MGYSFLFSSHSIGERLNNQSVFNFRENEKIERNPVCQNTEPRRYWTNGLESLRTLPVYHQAYPYWED